MTDRGGTRKIGNFGIRDFHDVGEFIGKITETRAQYESDARAQLGFAQNEFCGALGADKFRTGRRPVDVGLLSRRLFSAHENIPTIEADSRLAIVPASIARIPKRTN